MTVSPQIPAVRCTSPTHKWNELHSCRQRRAWSACDRSWELLITPRYVTFGPDARDSSIIERILSKTAVAGKVLLHTSPYRVDLWAY